MSVLTLAAAKTHLNITVATYDTELQDFIDAAEGAIAARCGPLVPTAITVKLLHPGGVMSLPTTPAISLTSITDSSGNALSLTGVTVSAEGIVFGLTLTRDLYTIVYQAGRASTPPNLLLAVKELLRYCWAQSQRGTTSRPGSSPSPEVVMGGMSLVDRLIEPYVQAP